MKIGFIGTGKIAEPMIRSLSRRFPESVISISTRSEPVSRILETELDNVAAGDNQWVLNSCDIVFLCVLARTAWKELPGLQFREDHRPVSVMADISIAEVDSLLAPARNCCVTIPLPFIEDGQCPLPVFPESQLLMDLFGGENEIITLDAEAQIGPHFAATAILSTLMAQLQCTSKWLGTETGNAVNAEIYVASLVSGYLGAMEKDGAGRFLEAMQDLTTEGGLNSQLLSHNREAGLISTLQSGLEALGRRLGGS